MNQRKLRLIYIALCANLLTACENELPMNLSQREPQLILNALLNAGEQENFVYLNWSGAKNIQHVTDASVILYLNGKETEIAQALPLPEWTNTDLPRPETLNQKKFRLTTLFHPGDVIRLEATAGKGQYHVSAEVKVPLPVDAIRVDTCTTIINNPQGPFWRKELLPARHSERHHRVWSNLLPNYRHHRLRPGK